MLQFEATYRNRAAAPKLRGKDLASEWDLSTREVPLRQPARSR